MPGDDRRGATATGRALRFGTGVISVGEELERRARRLRAFRAAGLVGVATLIGTLGFWRLDPGSHDLLTALYMTVITISTVGFSEVIPIHESNELMVFTIALTIGGVAATFHFFTSVMAMVVEGDLLFQVWRRRMQRSIDALEQHVVVAGAGSNGIHVIRELWQAKVPVVVIEADPERVEHLLAEFGERLMHVVGDAHEDTVLEAAGIRRARGLIATLHDDRDNLYLCLSARTMNPKARVIAKADEATNTEKFRRAGADAVVSPARIGGRRLAHEMVHPHVTSFFEGIFGADEQGTNLSELEVTEGAEIAGQSLAEAKLRARTNCMVVGVRPTPDGRYHFNPGPDECLPVGASLMVLGGTEEVAALRALVRGADG